MTTDTIHVELDLAERHTLRHLLKNFIHQRAWEKIQHADNSLELREGAEQARLGAQIQSLSEESEGIDLPREDLDAHRANLVRWTMEAEATADEHEESLVEADESDGDRQEVAKTIDHERESIVQDYAHRCVCVSIISQIDAAREPVMA